LNFIDEGICSEQCVVTRSPPITISSTTTVEINTPFHYCIAATGRRREKQKEREREGGRERERYHIPMYVLKQSRRTVVCNTQ